MRYQIYDASTGAWTTPSNNTVVNFVDPGSRELGPGPLLPNGTVFYTGATTSNAIYTGSRSAPGQRDHHSEAALISLTDSCRSYRNGNALFDTSPGVFGSAASSSMGWKRAAYSAGTTKCTV